MCDFGKATHKLNPVVYNLEETKMAACNTEHRHIAHELRNSKGFLQSEATDIYSLGRVYKYIGYHQGIESLFNLGIQMMCKLLTQRPDISIVCSTLLSCKQEEA